MTSKAPLYESELSYREKNEDYEDGQESCCISQFEEEIWSKDEICCNDEIRSRGDVLSSFDDALSEEVAGDKMIAELSDLFEWKYICCQQISYKSYKPSLKYTVVLHIWKNKLNLLKYMYVLFLFTKNITDCFVSENKDPETPEKEVNS